MRLAYLVGQGIADVSVSIPFSSGQRMRPVPLPPAAESLLVSIPFSSGQRMRRICIPPAIPRLWKVSIPFSSGQRMRLPRAASRQRRIRLVSIPFSSGQRMRPHSLLRRHSRKALFQSPFHRVKGCDRDLAGYCLLYLRVSIPFSSGQRMRLVVKGEAYGAAWRFNPLFIGSKDATGAASFGRLLKRRLFQSPFHRVKGCDRVSAHSIARSLPVSIPFSSGQRMRLFR